MPSAALCTLAASQIQAHEGGMHHLHKQHACCPAARAHHLHACKAHTTCTRCLAGMGTGKRRVC